VLIFNDFIFHLVLSILNSKFAAMKKKKLGGKREGAGRKELPKTEKKSPLTIYVKQSILDTIGIPEAKQIALKAIESIPL
jgi:hypothetical protein